MHDRQIIPSPKRQRVGVRRAVSSERSASRVVRPLACARGSDTRRAALRRPARAPAATAFTVIEALVSIALLLAVMLAVANVFSMTSLASGRAIGQAETIEAATAFEQAVRTQIERLKPNSLLIIESPAPLTAIPETSAGPGAFSLRHDRLVFIAQGGAPDTFRSQTDRNIVSVTGPGRLPFTSPEALIYVGPGDPDGRGLLNVTARDWILAQRIVLLGAPAGAFASFTGEQPPPQHPLNGTIATAPPRSIYACGIDAIQETGDALIARVLLEAPLSATTDAASLWDLNLCPSSVNTVLPTSATDNLSYYGRAAFNFAPRIADLRIEWTDGSVVDPTPVAGGVANPTTQWFGQRRDTGDIPASPPPPGTLQGWTGPGDAAGPSGDVCEKREWLRIFDPGGTLPDSQLSAFGQPPGGSSIESHAANSYRAMWVGPTWAFRPKALRFTFRVYDTQDRLTTVEHYDTTPWQSPTLWGPGGNPELLRRFGLEYSFVVKLPQ